MERLSKQVAEDEFLCCWRLRDRHQSQEPAAAAALTTVMATRVNEIVSTRLDSLTVGPDPDLINDFFRPAE